MTRFAHVIQVAQESRQEQGSQAGGAFEGARGSESTASGKLTGPLPWDVLGDHSDDENSTAGRALTCIVLAAAPRIKDIFDACSPG